MNKIFFRILLLLQILFLAGLAGSYYVIDIVGQDVRLKTAPVDPRDLFYGDYVTLNYEISSIPLSKWKGAVSNKYGYIEDLQGAKTIYVVLEENNGVHEVVAAYPEKPHLESGQLMIKGHFDSIRRRGQGSNEIRVIYGIERYYVQQDTGKTIQQHRSSAVVNAKVAPWGQGKITNIIY